MAYASIDDDLCPVSDDLLGRLYQAPAENIGGLIGAMESEMRARLALYCYRRAHFQPLGFALAAACERDMLHYLGGHVGDALFLRAHSEAEPKEPTHYQQRRKVTCATWAGPARSVSFDLDDVDSPELVPA